MRQGITGVDPIRPGHVSCIKALNYTLQSLTLTHEEKRCCECLTCGLWTKLTTKQQQQEQEGLFDLCLPTVRELEISLGGD